MTITTITIPLLLTVPLPDTKRKMLDEASNKRKKLKKQRKQNTMKTFERQRAKREHDMARKKKELLLRQQAM